MGLEQGLPGGAEVAYDAREGPLPCVGPDMAGAVGDGLEGAETVVAGQTGRRRGLGTMMLLLPAVPWDWLLVSELLDGISLTRRVLFVLYDLLDFLNFFQYIFILFRPMILFVGCCALVLGPRDLQRGGRRRDREDEARTWAQCRLDHFSSPSGNI